MTRTTRQFRKSRADLQDQSSRLPVVGGQNCGGHGMFPASRSVANLCPATMVTSATNRAKPRMTTCCRDGTSLRIAGSMIDICITSAKIGDTVAAISAGRVNTVRSIRSAIIADSWNVTRYVAATTGQHATHLTVSGRELHAYLILGGGVLGW